MPIKMRTYKDRPTDLGPLVSPIFVCDFCGEVIEKISQGVYVHRLFQDGDREVFILHHNATKRCHDAFELTHPLPGYDSPDYEKWGWDHLPTLLLHLINNCGAEWEELARVVHDENFSRLMARAGKLSRKMMEG